jgi:hypothetical protein
MQPARRFAPSFVLVLLAVACARGEVVDAAPERTESLSAPLLAAGDAQANAATPDGGDAAARDAASLRSKGVSCVAFFSNCACAYQCGKYEERRNDCARVCPARDGRIPVCSGASGTCVEVSGGLHPSTAAPQEER